MSRKRTPDQESPEATSAIAEPPAVEANIEGQGFADKVGKKKWEPAADPFGIAKDNVAGVRLFESRQDHQVAIKFGEGRPEDKPSQAVIDTIKEAGFRWNPANKIWTYPVRSESAMSTRIEAERLFQEVAKMIRKEKGIEAEKDLPLPF